MRIIVIKLSRKSVTPCKHSTQASLQSFAHQNQEEEPRRLCDQSSCEQRQHGPRFATAHRLPVLPKMFQHYHHRQSAFRSNAFAPTVAEGSERWI